MLNLKLRLPSEIAILLFKKLDSRKAKEEIKIPLPIYLSIARTVIYDNRTGKYIIHVGHEFATEQYRNQQKQIKH